MSKLNRKEFKQLLNEWKQNFINERNQLKYVKSVKPAILIPLPDNEVSSLEEFFKNYKRENPDISILENISSSSVYIDFGVILPKNIESKNLLLNYFNSVQNTKALNDIEDSYTNGGSEPILIVHAPGNANPELGTDNDEANIFYWLTHDLEHMMHGGEAFPNIHIDDTVRSNLSNMQDEIGYYPGGYGEVLGKDTQTQTALSKFFKEINFTPEVGAEDFPASVFAYCITRMKNKFDIQEVTNSNSLSHEEKEAIKNIFISGYDMSNISIDKLISTLENKILICLGF